MKLSIAAITVFVAHALAALSINNPVAGTVWPYNGSSVTISWVSDDSTTLTGTVTVQLMEGTDSNNLSPIYTVATSYDASKGSISFVPPTNLVGSSNYAVRVTSSVSGPHYSHFFQAGNPSVTESTSVAVTVSQSESSTSSEASTTSKEASSSAKSGTSSDDASSKDDDSSAEISDDSSEEESSEASSEEAESSEGESSLDESSDDSKSSGASRPAIAAGIIVHQRLFQRQQQQHQQQKYIPMEERLQRHAKVRTRSRSPSDTTRRGSGQQRKHKTSRAKVKDDDVPTITQDDYFRLNAPFRLWLRKEKDRYFDEMPTEKARTYFASFVRAWNSGHLRSRYYKQDSELAALSKSVVTRHSWKFAANLDRGVLDEVKEAVHRSNAPPGAAGEASAAAPRIQTQTQGPTMPSLEERRPESRRLFDDEQRDRDRQRRRRERRDAKEREQLILDEVAPKETGREAAIAKRRAVHRLRHAEKAPEVEISDSELFGDDASELASLKRDRAFREKLRLERQQETRAESSRGQRLQERQDKERSTVQMLQAMAQQSRDQGLGMMAHSKQRPER
ncbi:hypothetical protein LPJ74_000856 [Coemansia sp. RSA 1843]|nr:hypothetical protein LPJ74_000856 [Coemansia sp. RSA 1843]